MPISRDKLRTLLRIGRDRASALVAAVREEAFLTTRLEKNWVTR
jgi:hypothetical protein